MAGIFKSPDMKQALTKAQSSFLLQNYQTRAKGRGLTGPFYLVLIAFIIVIYIESRVIIADSYSSVLLIPSLLVFGVVFIAIGWYEFSMLEDTEAIPLAKIRSAANGLNEIQGHFISESGSSIKAAASSTQCLMYQLRLEQELRRRSGTYWAGMCSYGDALPLLMTDGTGYLAIDLKNASVADILTGKRYYILNKKNESVRTGTQEGKDFIQYLKSSPPKIDFGKFNFSTSDKKPDDIAVFKGNRLAISELVMPVDNSYFAMGTVTGISKSFDGLPVKVMSVGRNSKILDVTKESRSGVQKSEKKAAFLSLGLGILLAIVSLYLFIAGVPHLNLQSSAMANPQFQIMPIESTVYGGSGTISFYLSSSQTVSVSNINVSACSLLNVTNMFNGQYPMVLSPEQYLLTYDVNVKPGASGSCTVEVRESWQGGSSEESFQVYIEP